jgi:hypothetical protein
MVNSKDEAVHAVCPHPEPLVVFEDPDNEDNTQRFYLVFSGLVADNVQQRLSAACTGHAVEKGSLRCFILGGNTLPGGTASSTQRWWGLHHLADAEMLQAAPAAGDGFMVEAAIALQSRVGLNFTAEAHETHMDSTGILHRRFNYRMRSTSSEQGLLRGKVQRPRKSLSPHLYFLQKHRKKTMINAWIVRIHCTFTLLLFYGAL